MNGKARLILPAIIALLAIAAVSLALRNRGGAPTPSYEHAVFAPRPVTLERGIHLLGESAPGAAYVVETAAGLVLIDSGAEADASRVAKQLADLGLEMDELHLILITHVHGDHSLGAKRLRELTGAKIYAGADDTDPLERGGPRSAFFSTFYAPAMHPHPTSIDRRLRGGEVLELGDTKIEVIAAPGHTPGSLCFALERNGKRVLFTGDTICTISSVIGTYAAHLSPRYRGSAADYLSTLERLRAGPTPALVLPGHPRMGKTHQSPRISEPQWHALLESGIDEMRSLVERYAADGPDFLDGTPKQILPGCYYLGDVNEHAVYGLVSERRLFCFNAPAGDGLAEFIQAALGKLAIDLPLDTVVLTSADAAASGGAASLVAATGCRLVAPNDAVEAVRAACPADARVSPASEWNDSWDVEVEAFHFQGVGESPVAYFVTWGEQNLLITGGIPSKAEGEEAMQALVARLRSPSGDDQQYLSAIYALQKLEPDVWLPARPVQGQNANLYNSQWQDTLQTCLEIVFHVRSQ